MVSVIKRMRHLRTKLLGIRLGPGAAVLPKEVTRIHMEFAVQTNGHYGARKFWKQYLPRLKYHNPAVPMTVNRTKDAATVPVLTIHYTDSASAAGAAPAISSTTSSTTSTGPVPASTSPPPTVRTETIDMKHYQEPEILARLMELTKARQVLPTPEEAQEVEDLERKAVESEKVSQKAKIVRAAKKRAEEVIEKAKQSMA
ncbi:50s ribosomal protein mrp49 [Phlyctema vagabunda]|uniref:50s ribosomal protein mrp49 n=1 Tax=Phlyctema vagabunda TaxID=108571 RepID=A0ABR4P399_9HELO